MCILEDHVRASVHGVTDDAFVQRVIPDRRRRDHDIVLSERFGEFLEMFRLPADEFAARLLERRGVEQPVSAQILVVVADHQFELRARMLREPRGSMHRRLVLNRWIDYRKNLRYCAHRSTLESQQLTNFPMLNLRFEQGGLP